MSVRLLSLLFATLLLGCGDQAPPSESGDRLTVYTSFFPTTDFARRIGRDAVEVTCPLPPDADPIFWEPGADVLAAYQAADLIVLNGAGLEKWVVTRSLPGSKVVDCAASFEADWLKYEHATTHSHGGGGEHTHQGIDGHTWLDPELAEVAVGAIEAALAERRPSQAAAFAQRADALRAALDSLDAGLRELSRTLGERPLWTNHPAYNYLARRYGWTVVNFDIDPASELSTEARTQLVTALEAANGAPAAILFEAEPIPTLRTALEGLGLRPVEFSPGEGPPDDAAGGYIGLMRANIARLGAALEG